MSTRNWPRHLLCLSLSLPLGSALACGPDFPLRLLDDRAQSLAELPESNFQFEVNRLGEAIAGLKPATEATLTPYGDTDDNGKPYRQQRDKVEASELPENLRAEVTRLRGLQDPQQVETQGAGLPAELRLYIAGAVAFQIGDAQRAVDYFRQVLALPVEQRKLRSTWAAYSLGRALVALSVQAVAGADSAESGGVAPVVSDTQLLAQARLAFQQTRALSAGDFSDPLELGIASLGEEARLARLDNDWNSAIALYASQSRLGSNSGYSSLRQVADELAKLPSEQLSSLLKEENVQALLTADLLSRVNWISDEEPEHQQRLSKLLLASVRGSLYNADRLAALSYQKADYAAAKAFVEHAGDGGLAWWVRAKLALRDGNKVQAAAAYAKAAQAFPKDEVWGQRRAKDWSFETVQPNCRAQGESAILALDRGDYLQAFDQLYRTQGIYWLDAATVAERVLTLDELKTYVDAHVPAPTPKPEDKDKPEDSYVRRPELRELLGRRLLREGRYDEAPKYFDSPELQAIARDYGRDRQQAVSRWTATGRAESLFAAATLARKSGMEILGYEMAPDYRSLDGYYSLETPPLQPAAFLETAEIQRRQATVAKPDRRYHYRWVAVDLANQAADQLPRSSQAFAAVLCQAASWVAGSDEEVQLYQRYVEQGPYVSWAANFGKQCQAPNFDQANRRYLTQPLNSLRSALRPYKVALIVAALAVFGGLAVWVRRRKAKL